MTAGPVARLTDLPEPTTAAGRAGLAALLGDPAAR